VGVAVGVGAGVRVGMGDGVGVAVMETVLVHDMAETNKPSTTMLTVRIAKALVISRLPLRFAHEYIDTVK
jgi:ABC-type cobalamin transport system permease subunit